MCFDKADDRNCFPAHFCLIVVGADLHDFAVFGALDNLVVVEGVLLVGDDQDHRVGVIDGAGVLHSLLGLGKGGVFKYDLQDLEVLASVKGTGVSSMVTPSGSFACFSVFVSPSPPCFAV